MRRMCSVPLASRIQELVYFGLLNNSGDNEERNPWERSWKKSGIILRYNFGPFCEHGGATNISTATPQLLYGVCRLGISRVRHLTFTTDMMYEEDGSLCQRPFEIRRIMTVGVVATTPVSSAVSTSQQLSRRGTINNHWEGTNNNKSSETDKELAPCATSWICNFK